MAGNDRPSKASYLSLGPGLASVPGPVSVAAPGLTSGAFVRADAVVPRLPQVRMPLGGAGGSAGVAAGSAYSRLLGGSVFNQVVYVPPELMQAMATYPIGPGRWDTRYLPSPTSVETTS